MPPLPKPKGQTRRRNLDQGRWKDLPGAKPFKRPPNLPDRKPAWRKSTRSWWATIWASPMAAMWVEADVPSLVDLARLVDDDLREPLNGARLNRKGQLEDRFGLSPKARRALQWEITQAEEAEEQGPAKVRHLRAVDPVA